MPPRKCPECGRFLKNALVDDLVRAPVPCPKCGVELTAEMFGLAAEPAAAAPAVPSPATAAAASIRPPDLRPDTVRDRQDPLAGWDVGVPPPVVEDRRPFPTDTVLVAAGAVVGGVAGTLATDRRARGGVLGALAGLVAAGVVRRVWLLPDV